MSNLFLFSTHIYEIREIGADNFVLSNKLESMASAAKSLDLILNTVSADHDLTALIGRITIRMMMTQPDQYEYRYYDDIQAC